MRCDTSLATDKIWQKKSIHMERSLPEKLLHSSFESTRPVLRKQGVGGQQKHGVQLKEGMGQQCSARMGQLESAAAAREWGDTACMVREPLCFLSLSHQKKEQGQHALRKLHRGVELRNTRQLPQHLKPDRLKDSMQMKVPLEKYLKVCFYSNLIVRVFFAYQRSVGGKGEELSSECCFFLLFLFHRKLAEGNHTHSIFSKKPKKTYL